MLQIYDKSSLKSPKNAIFFHDETFRKASVTFYNSKYLFFFLPLQAVKQNN